MKLFLQRFFRENYTMAHDLNPNTFKHTAFLLITQMCIAEGGDGDAAFVSEDYEKLANDFEVWVNKQFPNTYVRHSSQESAIPAIIFSCGDEAIWFVKDLLVLPSWVNNILVKPVF